ncbi:copper-translocating p-type ATPase [Colletotrichum truncatum]|uniref:Copper-translocating p-type ATPase n=1 Tax=Colletotrichum truncatum TaxID=5467 RepID=A0ACC3YN46_COLTU|nr:copper-translocating p-type ATPase [Colletotrichum truncatum]KAF6782584.1 copper-translocating p-type ATPase [Colletotrichum truncatum]
MACESGCCGPPKDPAPSLGGDGSPTVPNRVNCSDNAINPLKENDEIVESCSSSDMDNATCSDGCCGPSDATLIAVERARMNYSDIDNGCQNTCDTPIKINKGVEEVKKNEHSAKAEGNCGKGCCGATSPPNTTDPSSNKDSCEGSSCEAKPRTDDSSKKGCCDLKPTETVDSSCVPEIETEKTCEDGCCGDKTGEKVDNCCGPKTVATEDHCKKNCCGNTDDTVKEIRASEAAAEEDGDCNKGCCGSTPKTKPVETDAVNRRAADNNCCFPHSESGGEIRKRGCSSTSAVKPTVEKAPSCCEGKTSPCCNSSCIDRLALRECTKESSVATRTLGKGSTREGSCTGGRDGKPCRRHARSVREIYQAKLEALGCICRALLALGQESCCAPNERSSFKRKQFLSKPSRPRSSVDSCCAPGTSGQATQTKKRPGPKKGCRPVSPKKEGGGCADGCCAKPKALNNAGACADACGDDDISPVPIGINKHVVQESLRETDLEKGLHGREHVILSVSGMTCTGCETKLKRTLATLSAVKNLKTSLVLARAEFDMDLSAASPEDIIKHLERTTEFKCEKISSEGASLDLLCPGQPEDFINQPWPKGVTDIRIIEKKFLHVEFDAEIIGARDLVEKGWATPMELAPPRADPTLQAGGKHVRNVGLMTLLSIVLTVPVLVMAWAPLPKNEIAYGSASLALATIVQVVIAGPFYPKALKSLIFSRMIEMDLLIVLSTSAAYIFSVISFGYLVSHKPLSTGEFFETSTLLVTLIMVGRYVSALARQKAVESISIRSLQTSNAILLDPSQGQKEIDSRLLQYGDIFKVVADSRIPTDGTVISGSSEVDESMITGESKVVDKYPGSAVIAGSINGSGSLDVRLTRLPGDNTISTIAGMVDEAKLSKPKIQDIADRVASYFVPVVVALTIITFAIWIAIGIAVRKQSGSEATIQAVTYAITVLIVSCPCAIGLAVPMVIVIATGVAAERGVIFKSAESIEVAYKTTHVVFDKTGTLTQGKLSIVHEYYLNNDQNGTQALLLGLIGSSKHPVSAAVATHLKTRGISETEVPDAKALTGKGIEATVRGSILRAGNSRWLGLSSDPKVEFILSQGCTAFCFTVDGTMAAVFGLEDSVRPDALTTISKLRASGIEIHILSGDDDGAVRKIATQLDIPEANIRSRCNPGDKQAYIQNLLSAPFVHSHKKPKKPVVIFCGDGTNDSVALAQATIGVHMNEGTDVAKSAADVVLMRPSLAGILVTIAISQKAIHRIAFNFGWSFVYNLFAILLGAGAFVNARIPPEFAGLGELASVLPVIAAAVLLRWSKV